MSVKPTPTIYHKLFSLSMPGQDEAPVAVLQFRAGDFNNCTHQKVLLIRQTIKGGASQIFFHVLIRGSAANLLAVDIGAVGKVQQVTVLFPPDKSCYASSYEKILRHIIILSLPKTPNKRTDIADKPVAVVSHQRPAELVNFVEARAVHAVESSMPGFSFGIYLLLCLNFSFCSLCVR